MILASVTFEIINPEGVTLSGDDYVIPSGFTYDMTCAFYNRDIPSGLITERITLWPGRIRKSTFRLFLP